MIFIQGITDDEVAKLLGIFEGMVLQHAQKRVRPGPNQEGTRNLAEEDYGKHVVRAPNELFLTMIDLLKTTKEEFVKAAYKIDGQSVKARLEVSLQRRPSTKAVAPFFQGLEEMKGDESKVMNFFGKLQISFHVGRGVAAKFTREGESHAEEDRVIDMKAVATIFRTTLFSKPWRSQVDPRPEL